MSKKTTKSNYGAAIFKVKVPNFAYQRNEDYEDVSPLGKSKVSNDSPDYSPNGKTRKSPTKKPNQTYGRPDLDQTKNPKWMEDIQNKTYKKEDTSLPARHPDRVAQRESIKSPNLKTADLNHQELTSHDVQKTVFENSSIQSTKQLSYYDVWDDDLTPEQWLAKCQAEPERNHAKSPIYENYKYIWVNVKVVDYDPTKKRFLVKIAHNETMKWVGRLSLLFFDEDPAKFQQRVEECKARQYTAEDEMRFFKFIDHQSDELVSSLPEQSKKNIHDKTVRALKLDEENPRVAQLHQDLKSQTEHLYVLHMKKFNILVEMMDPDTHKMFEEARVRIRTNPEVVPYYALIAQLDYQFQPIRNKIEKVHVSSKKEVVETVGMIADKAWEYEGYKLFHVTIPQNQLPMELKHFMKVQSTSYTNGKQTIKVQWRDYLISEIQDYLREIYKFYQTESKSYLDSELQRLLIKIDYIFNTQVRNNLVTSTLNMWSDFLRKFIYVDSVAEDQAVWAISEVPLLVLDIKFRKKHKKVDKKSKGKDKLEAEKDKPEDEEDEDEEDQAIYFSPSLARVVKGLIKPIEWLVELTNSLNKLEADLVPLLDVKKGPTYPITMENDEIKVTVDKIREYVEIGFQKPNEIIEKFRAFQFLYERSSKELIKSLFEKEKPTVESLNEELKRLDKAIKEVGSLCINERNTHFFQVRTQVIKENIINRAKDISQSILTRISELCVENVGKVSKSYQELQAQLEIEPKDEDEWVNLRDSIRNHEKNIAALQEQVKQITAYLDLLEDYQFNYKEDDNTNYWFLKGWPGEIKDSVLGAQRKSDVQEKKFLEKLENEKDNFYRDLEKFTEEFRFITKLDNYERSDENWREVHNLDDKIKAAQETVKSFNKRETIFNIDVVDYEELELLREQFLPYLELWDLVYSLEGDLRDWHSGPFAKLSAPVIERRTDYFSGEIGRLKRRFEEGEDGGNELAVNVIVGAKAHLDKFRKEMPLIELLTTEAMTKKPQYWKEVFQLADMPFNEISDEITLDKLVEKDLLESKEQLEEISNRATKQWNLEKTLNEMNDKIRNIKLEFVEHKKLKGIYLVKTTEEVSQILDDQLNLVQMLKASPFIKPVIKKANDIESKLVLIQDTLENWMTCQRGWTYLEPIFSSDDIKKRLAKETTQFERIDETFKKLMEVAYKESQNGQMFDSPEMDFEKVLHDLEENNRRLELIQKSLAEYLETKRQAFARFYFLSDDELLEILAQTKDPLAVQPHISKCFEAIQLLEFQGLVVTAMISAEKEKVTFLKKIDVEEGELKGNVEKWLLEVERIMQLTLTQITKDSLADTTPRNQWVLNWPGQVVLAVNNIRWTQSVEDAILRTNEMDLEKFEKVLGDELLGVVELVRGELTDLERLTLGALITLDVHARDVVHDLVTASTDNITDFNWISQLRYYWDDSKNPLKVRMINAEIKYAFEYLGNSTRLVITPLTDRCYRTLMGAYYLYYGGAPEGPAGTGKTESVKDLAKAVAIQCVVFNCSDTLNYLAMAKFFKGLASSGAWCCFDEFNRIDLEVLSVIAQQVLAIQSAIRDKKRTFTFEGTDIVLIHSCAINITMNPGYAGRSELPDNLKALFRACAMMVPDYAMIAEIVLFSVGFQDARNLARKAVALLKLSSEQLSTQSHYDFGMRALKAILTAAGQLKRKMLNEEEDIVVLRALSDVNLPKFTMNDVPLFQSITSDLFPKKKLPDPDYGKLEQKIIQAIQENNLMPEPAFVKKCIQLYETIMVRHGLMVVGAAFAGKSKVLSSLEKAFNLLKGEPDFNGALSYKINPKSITITQLYGKFDIDSKAWSDGVLALVMRMCTKDADNPERKWIIFDGPVDAVWIENMNTVLDDNKKLCLNSGEIIKLTNQMTMMFEVEDLSQASPATVSRCGMVYLETKQLGWVSLIKSFVRNMPKILEKHADYTFTMLKWILDPCLVWVARQGRLPMPISDMMMTNSALVLMKIWLNDYNQEGAKVPKDIEDQLNNLIFFSIIWSVGVALEEPSRPGFHDLMVKLNKCEDVRETLKMDLEYSSTWEPKALGIKMNDSPNIFDITYDRSKNVWKDWMQTIPAFQIPKGVKFHELIVPTIDSLRNAYFLRVMVDNQRHILFTGPTGTGKTITILNELAQNYFNDEYSNLATAFSGQTHSNQVQKTIEAKMNTRRRKGYYGPEDRKKFMVIFIDDINMPAKEKYGAQPPIELLRQWMDYGGWYDLETKEFKHLQDMNFVAAMGPPSAGRNTITQRYTRHFNIHYVEPFSTNSLQRIFTNVLDWYFMNGVKTQLPKSILNLRDNIVNSTIELYNKIKTSKELLPTPAKSHYVYNLRDISKVFQGMSRATEKSFSDENDFIKLWAHECMRVFSDRLISEADQNYFKELLKTITTTNFRREWSFLVAVEPLLWADFVPTLYPDGDTSKKPYINVYCELTNRDAVRESANRALQEFNDSQKIKLNLVLFMNAIEHIIRIVRIMKTTFGHALLVGVGGSGRKSLAYLATFIAGFDNKQIEITKQYGPKEWAEDLMGIMSHAGLGKETVFIFNDTQIWKESILEDISSLLNNGEVPNLFPNEEKAKIIEEISEKMPQGTINEKWNHFLATCRKNLHMIVCVSPVGEAFRRRLRTFPSLVNCTTIDWFLPWPEEALRSVAESLLKPIELAPELKGGIIDICVDMQERVSKLSERYYQELRKYYYVTPTSYLELLGTFMRLLSKRKEQVEGGIERYSGGLEKLIQTDKDVKGKEQYLNVLKPQLEEKNKEAKKKMENLGKQSQEADEQKRLCEKEEAECNIKREDAMNLKEDCERELAKVVPILERATEALKTVKPADLTFLKSLNTVTDPVMLTMKGVCIIFHESVKVVKIKEGMAYREDYWETARKYLLNNPGALLKRIQGFGVEQISQVEQKTIDKLDEFIKDPKLEESVVANASAAAAAIASWIRAVVETYKAYQIVEPKQKQLGEAESKLKAAEEILAQKKAELQKVLDLIDYLQKDYQQTKDEEERLQTEVKRCEVQLVRAKELVSGLSNEQEQWGKRAKQLASDSLSVTGDVLLSSGIIAYLGAFPNNYRDECVEIWKKQIENKNIIYSKDFSIQNILSDAITIGSWTNKYKLPNDTVSIDNAIILKNSRRWPLLIDPQVQANKWIRNMEKEHNLCIIRLTQNPNEYTRNLENAIQFGLPVLLENIGETIEAVFEPVLAQRKEKKGGAWKLKWGEGFIDLSNDFRFYVTTKLPRPHYPPEICVQVTLLNFTVNQVGLEDQMLNIVVKEELPSLEEKRQRNIIDYFEKKDRQKSIEDNILAKLSSAGDNILDDVDLISTLKSSKIEALEIEHKLVEQERDNEKFKHERVQYQPVAARVSHLFFIIAELVNVEPMYQYSLDWYISLFKDAIQFSEVSSDRPTRCANIINEFMNILYKNICRSLLEKDKLLFSFLVTTKIMDVENKTNQTELRFLMVGGTATIPVKPNPSGEGGWMSNRQWSTFEEVAQVFPSIFTNFDTEFIANLGGWEHVFNAEDPMEEKWPGGWFEKLTTVQRLIVIRILRPDKVVSAIQTLISIELGPQFIDPPSFNLEVAFQDSKWNVPIIFILSPGVNPMSELIKLADKLGYRNMMDALSLGQGQDAPAEAAIKTAIKDGRWVILQNCHLAVSFMPNLERIVETLPPDCNEGFRLWLTSMPSDKFPVTVLQNGIKLTNEPPRGLRLNVLKSYNNLNPKTFEDCNKVFEWKKLLFGLCFFHAHVQERKKFGPLGWNIPYEFSQPDWEISKDQLKIFLNDYEDIPWDALNYMVAEANYGGKVTDPLDRRLIKVILKEFYCEDILDDNYKFSPSGNYFVPTEGPLDSYKEYIQKLPYNDKAEVFGLHNNAAISSSIIETNMLLGTALSLQPRSVSGGGMSPDQMIKEKCAALLNKLPQLFDLEDASKKHPLMYEESMNTVLQQELLRFNNLLNVVKNSMRNLSKAIDGLVVMSADLENVFNSMFDNLVPEVWAKVAYPSLKPLGSWINDLIERLNFIQKWIDNGAPPAFWISGFFFTQSFLTGTLQNFARKHSIPIDTLLFDFYVIRKDDPKCDVTKTPEDGCYIYGLYLDGCRWDEDEMCLAESIPKILNYKVPHMWLVPTEQSKLDTTKHVYESPVYKTSRRAGTLSTTGHSTNFVLNINLPMSGEHTQTHWIKRGVALLTQLDD